MASIQSALDEFLTEQRARLSDRSYRNYESVIVYLMKNAVREGFSELADLDKSDHRRRLYDNAIEDSRNGSVEALLGALDASGILDNLGMFLTYFMPVKVLDGVSVQRAVLPTVKRLVKFLADREYINQDLAAGAADEIEEAEWSCDYYGRC